MADFTSSARITSKFPPTRRDAPPPASGCASESGSLRVRCPRLPLARDTVPVLVPLSSRTLSSQTGVVNLKGAAGWSKIRSRPRPVQLGQHVGSAGSSAVGQGNPPGRLKAAAVRRPPAPPGASAGESAAQTRPPFGRRGGAGAGGLPDCTIGLPVRLIVILQIKHVSRAACKRRRVRGLPQWQVPATANRGRAAAPAVLGGAGPGTHTPGGGPYPPGSDRDRRRVSLAPTRMRPRLYLPVLGRALRASGEMACSSFGRLRCGTSIYSRAAGYKPVGTSEAASASA
jgi:hypothetical protein